MDGYMRAFFSTLALLFTSAAHGQIACHQYEQELARAERCTTTSTRQRQRGSGFTNRAQDACKRLKAASPICQWVISQTVNIIEHKQKNQRLPLHACRRWNLNAKSADELKVWHRVRK
jgi:hypothetical protein